MWRVFYSFENKKILFWGIEPMTITLYASMKQQPRGNMTSFHNAPCYLTCETEVELIFQPMKNGFSVVMGVNDRLASKSEQVLKYCHS